MPSIKAGFRDAQAQVILETPLYNFVPLITKGTRAIVRLGFSDAGTANGRKSGL